MIISRGLGYFHWRKRQQAPVLSQVGRDAMVWKAPGHPAPAPASRRGQLRVEREVLEGYPPELKTPGVIARIAEIDAELAK